MHMLKERLQILITSDQRRRLEVEARRRRTSVGSVIRSAIDAHIGVATRQRRMRAVEAIRSAPTAPYLEPAAIDQLAESEHDELAPAPPASPPAPPASDPASPGTESP
jgi:hypothetical protein